MQRPDSIDSRLILRGYTIASRRVVARRDPAGSFDSGRHRRDRNHAPCAGHRPSGEGGGVDCLDGRGAHDGRAARRRRRLRPQGRRAGNPAGGGARRGGGANLHRSRCRPEPRVGSVEARCNGRPRRAYATRARRAAPRRARPIQPRDRGGARHRRRNRQDARGAHAVETAGGKPGSGHRAGAQARAGDARGAGGRPARTRKRAGRGFSGVAVRCG